MNKYLKWIKGYLSFELISYSYLVDWYYTIVILYLGKFKEYLLENKEICSEHEFAGSI